MPPMKGRSSRTGDRLTRMMALICTCRMRTAITGVMFTAGSTFSLPARCTAEISPYLTLLTCVFSYFADKRLFMLPEDGDSILS